MNILKMVAKVAGVAVLGVTPDILNQVGASVPEKYRPHFAVAASITALFIRRPQDQKPKDKLL